MTRTRRTRTFAALAAAAVIPLAACGSDSEGEGESSSSASSESNAESSGSESSGSGSSSSEDTASSSDTASESSSEESGSASGSGDVTSAQAGVSFDVPDGWQQIDAEEIAANPDQAPPELEAAAEAQGVSVEQFLQQITQQTDLVVLGETEDGFTPNINVIASPQVPTDAQIESQLSSSGTVEGTEDLETPIGTGTDTTYVLPMGGVEVQGRMLVVPTDSGAAIITVSAGDAETADSVVGTVAESLSAA